MTRFLSLISQSGHAFLYALFVSCQDIKGIQQVTKIQYGRRKRLNLVCFLRVKATLTDSASPTPLVQEVDSGNSHMEMDVMERV